MMNIRYHRIGGSKNLKEETKKKFIKQISHLKKRHGLPNINFTFDHGTIDHYFLAAKELEKIGARGIFFILSSIPESLKIPSEDKQRRIESLSRKKLARELCKSYKFKYNPNEAKKYLKQFKFYSLEERYLRYLRNEKLSRKQYEKFIDKQYKKKFGNDYNYIKKNYMNWKHIISLKNRGHEIGSHSHDHYGDKNDYKKSLNIIKKKIKKNVNLISYPNGNKRISDKDLKSLGVLKGFTTSSKKNKNKFYSPRIDCNQIKI